MEEASRFLRKIFSDTELVRILSEKSLYKVVPPRKRVIEAGKYVRSVPLVIEGRIKVMHPYDVDKEIMLCYIDPGESCSLSIGAGVTGQKSIIYADTETETKLLSLPIDALPDLIFSYPQMTSFILSHIHKRFMDLFSYIDSIVFQKMDERLLQHLKRKTQYPKRDALHVTHQQLANELGTAREVVSRLLKQLEQSGKIVSQRSKIILLEDL